MLREQSRYRVAMHCFFGHHGFTGQRGRSFGGNGVVFGVYEIAVVNLDAIPSAGWPCMRNVAEAFRAGARLVSLRLGGEARC